MNARKDLLTEVPTFPSRFGVLWQYDASEKIIYASHSRPVELNTREEMSAYFDEGIRFWRLHCREEKVYVLVDYNNLTANIEEVDFYAKQVKRVIEVCAVTVIRYNGSMLQRMASRMTAIKLHTPSNTYASLREALAVVRGLKAGTISIQPPPSPTPH